MRWLLIIGLVVCLNAQSKGPAHWVGVGHLTDNIVMYYSIRADEMRSSLDAAVLVKLDPDATRNGPDGYHPAGGAELGSHSIFYDAHTRTVWADGSILLRLDDANVLMLREALGPRQPPIVIGTAFAGREIPNQGMVMNRDIRDLLLAAPEIRDFLTLG